MSKDNTTTVARPTTLSQRELFAIFSERTIVRQSDYGSKTSFKSRDAVFYGGDNHGLGALSERIIEDASADDNPADFLWDLLDGLRELEMGVSQLMREFHAFKAHHALPDDEEEDRYRVPASSSDALAHPPHGSGTPDGVAFLGSAGDRS